jgi:hypothetical protein
MQVHTAWRCLALLKDVDRRASIRAQEGQPARVYSFMRTRSLGPAGLLPAVVSASVSLALSVGCTAAKGRKYAASDYFSNDASTRSSSSGGDDPYDTDPTNGDPSRGGGDDVTDPGDGGGASDDGGSASRDGGRALVAPAIGLSGDVAAKDGDLRSGVLARQASTGDLWFYPWSGAAFLARVRIGIGWGGVDRIVGVDDVTGDQHPDIVARDASNGSLWLYAGDAKGGLRAGGWIGDGRAVNLMAGPGDLDGDGNADLVTTTSDGTLWLYPGNGNGGLLAPRQLDADVSDIDTLVPIGDLDADGHADLVGREAMTGNLWLYPGDGGGGFGARRAVGFGWSAMDWPMGTGDFNGDGTPDLVAREAQTMRLWLYPANVGSFGTRVEIGHDWGAMDLLASACAGAPGGANPAATKAPRR